ncbi:hypothetical protein LPJ73_002965 [Coemansia sp. RSA 2703]|nr:hypothetical protein LPJ73_002965 [Coemansia sp. RSA 2703]
MSRRVTNFDYEIYPESSGFHSVRASTLPGRTTSTSDWCTGAWPQFHGRPFFAAHTLGPAHFTPFYHTRRTAGITDAGFFAPPTAPAPPAPPAEAPVVEQLADRRVVRLRSAVFREARPTVQAKGGVLRVAARVAKKGERKNGGVVEQEGAYEYSTTLGPADDVRRITAARNGDTLTLTIPRRK